MLITIPISVRPFVVPSQIEVLDHDTISSIPVEELSQEAVDQLVKEWITGFYSRTKKINHWERRTTRSID